MLKSILEMSSVGSDIIRNSSWKRYANHSHHDIGTVSH
jgi:hypothetical protein